MLLPVSPSVAMVHANALAIPDLPDERKRVPNAFPSIEPTGSRIAIILTCPSADDEFWSKPLMSASDTIFNSLLNSVGIMRAQCFVGYLCNIRPPNDNFYLFGDNSTEVQESCEKLTNDLAKFKPNVIILLGRDALRYAKGVSSIEAYRGSLFVCNDFNSPFFGFKCISTFTPQYITKDYASGALVKFDLTRAKTESYSSTLVLPHRKLDIHLSANETIDRLNTLNSRGVSAPVWVSFDIEGYVDKLTHCSISTTPTTGFLVAFDNGDWTLEEEMEVWIALSRFLSNPQHPKVLQNSLYDLFVLAYSYKVVIRNLQWDTMLAHWELYAELEKNLGLQCSIYTREPYYKSDRTNDEVDIRYRYCCLDSAVTLEIKDRQQELLITQPASYKHFRLFMELLRPLLFMELQGIRYDADAAKKALVGVYAKLYALQHNLNKYADCALSPELTETDLFNLAVSKHGTVRTKAFVTSWAELLATCKKASYEQVQDLCNMMSCHLPGEPFTDSELGRASMALESHLNVDSSKQLNHFLYTVKQFTPQFKVDKKTKKKSLSSDVHALLALYMETKDDVTKTILAIRAQHYQVETLTTKCDPDGRIRCGYNIVGTETARLACYASPSGTGYNLQTVTKKLRYLLKADLPDEVEPEGYEIGQFDLSGADGWTVAAHCARLGDDTMLKDYQFGLKPAKILALMYMYDPNEVMSWSREQLKVKCKEIDGDGWLYFACKGIQHGSNYQMGVPTMCKNILKNSYKYLGEPIAVEHKVAAQLQKLYLMRYHGIKLWHEWVGKELLSKGYLVAASGRKRVFMGRLRDPRGVNNETLRAALSNEPQDNTTYATDMALWKLWNDPENRRPDGSLIIRPMHHVHDAMLPQWPKRLREWAIKKIYSYFNNELTIAGMKLVIPFEGTYGPSWGEQDNKA